MFEILRGNNPINLKNNNSNIEFQIIDWQVDNKEIKDEDILDIDEPENKSTYKEKQFLIKAYGVTLNGNSICLNINNFPPHFYIEIPDNWESYKVKMFMNTIKKNREFPKYLHNSILNYDIVKRKKFWGFTNNKTFSFLRILFKNTNTLYTFNKLVTKLNKQGGFKLPGMRTKHKYDIFESNIPPLLRFLHTQKLHPAGWIKLNKGKYYINYKNESMTQMEFNIEWSDVEMIEKTQMAPFIIASYDIEADSSHGDFPLPKKTYKKLTTELVSYYYKYKLENEKNKDIVESVIYDIIKSSFENGSEQYGISKIYTKNNIKPNNAKIKIISKKIQTLLELKENYKIMVIDIISKYHNTEVTIDEEEIEMNLENHKKIIEFIEDAFDENDNKTNYFINKIYTKQNNKPNKSIIIEISKKLVYIYSKLIGTIDDEHLELAFDIISNYTKIYNLDISSKIEYLFDTIESLKQESIEEYKPIIKTIINSISNSVNQMMSIINDKFPEIDSSNETKIRRCDSLLCDLFPEVEGDKVIQIGTTVQKYGENECFIKHIVTLDTCTSIDGCIVEECKTEAEVLLKWTKFIQLLDPDIITGYNIFGFDYNYMFKRSEELQCLEEFSKLSRIRDKSSTELVEKTLSSSALGENNLTYIQMEGRVQLDLFKIIQRDHNLVSYKLDYVAETFINDTITHINNNNNNNNNNNSTLTIKGIVNLNLGNYITININNDKYKKGQKLKIIDIDYTNNTITINDNINTIFDKQNKYEWTLAKDDVSPNDIFRFQNQGPDERKIIAVYCIQDCALCLHIINKLQIITNNIAMANVCYVPLSFIFLRGQGIKILSLVSRRCREEKYLIPVIKHENEERKLYNRKFEYGDEDVIISTSDEDGYEGAIVLKPQPGIYLEEYTSILDYASLYPSSMISENLCHTSIIFDKKYMGDQGIEELKKINHTHVDITYDVYKWVDKNMKSKGKVKTGVKTCRFAQLPNNEKSIIPRILEDLLSARKKTKKRMKNETDEFQKSVLDGLQLAFKITANSLYGQIGARTSAIYLKDIAASTTATGRKLLYLAKDKIIEHFEGSKAIYGDTDSVFIDFSPKDENGTLLKGKEGLKKSIELAVEAENYVQKFLKPPHKLEYEKTFWPFILFSKKRYIGYKYEFDVDKYKETSMGIVLKRRDNAEIVKHTYGSVIDILLKERNLSKSITTLQNQLLDLLDGKFPIEMLVISKSLRGYYKNPNGIAHKVLADRMAKRDPGNKPMTNDRIPFVYIETKEFKNKKVLQGDRVEHPDYIMENNLKPDYKFYITNQILKPICQIYALIAEKLDGFNKGDNYYNDKYEYFKTTLSREKALSKVNDLRFTDATNIIFGEVLRKANNRKNKSREITDFFKIKPT